MSWDFVEHEKITFKDWEKGRFVKILCIGNNEFYGEDDRGINGMWDKDHCWLPYTPPKRKVKMWKWVMRNKETGKVYQSEYYYKDIKDLEDPNYLEILFRIEDSMIEVEE